jgi:ppGpp synthetase/RelA/SpoT-type nucleotidyltranferase
MVSFYKSLLFFTTIINNIIIVSSFVTNANFIINSEQKIFNQILDTYRLPCHLQTARVKSFESSLQKMKRVNTENVYDLYDLIGFRFVFYTKEDLLKFYHHVKLEKTLLYTKNYILNPKENGYAAMHLRYKNEYSECPIKQLECQLYIISDYYNALYGNAKRIDKNYTLYF